MAHDEHTNSTVGPERRVLGVPAAVLVTALKELGIGCLCLAGLLALVREVTWEYAPSIHVQWKVGLPADERAALENRFQLVLDQQTGANDWAYDLLDTSPANIQALIEHPAVADTMDLDRDAYRPRGNAAVGDHTAWLIHRLPVSRYLGLGLYVFHYLLGLEFICLAGVGFLRGRETQTPASPPNSPAH